MLVPPAGSVRSGRPRAVRAVSCLAVLALTGGVALAAAPTAAAAGGTSATGLSSVSLLSSRIGMWGDDRVDQLATTTSGAYSAADDPGSLYTVTSAIGARDAWTQQITGKDVGVALLDTGVNRVTGLDGARKIVYGPDLSIEGNGVLAHQDTFGHGTHLAGIIGARDTGPLSRSVLGRTTPSTQLGVAPDATIESMKLATTDGSADVSQVIAALDWIVQHPTMPDGTPVRVVNLAYGTESVQPYQLDPLAAAAENAWRHGIVVVVAAGNDGAGAGSLNDPAVDPYLLSVGASAPGAGTGVKAWRKPTVADFSSVGSAQRSVDLVAPGRSIASLRNPGSFVDRANPNGQVASDASGRLFRGSGTSQAAAVVSGAVALLLQAYPSLTPDQVKWVLTHSADRVDASTLAAGAGELDVDGALALGRLFTGPLAGAVSRRLGVTQTFPVSTGQGSIEAARGNSHLVDPDGTVLTGEIDVQGKPWNPATWWAAASTATAWQGGTWNGSVWTGGDWATTGGWDSARWDSARWDSARWDSARWDSARWDSARWDSARWDSARWDSARWDSARWDSARWDSARWDGARWDAASWGDHGAVG